jgi:hypothetical protein
MTNTPKSAPVETKESESPAEANTNKSAAVGPTAPAENESAAKPDAAKT